jgi:hypothetical protein
MKYDIHTFEEGEHPITFPENERHLMIGKVKLRKGDKLIRNGTPYTFEGSLRRIGRVKLTRDGGEPEAFHFKTIEGEISSCCVLASRSFSDLPEDVQKAIIKKAEERADNKRKSDMDRVAFLRTMSYN